MLCDACYADFGPRCHLPFNNQHPRQAALLSVVIAPRIGAELTQSALEALASGDPSSLAAALESRRRGREQPGGGPAAAVMDLDAGDASGEEDELAAVLAAAAATAGDAPLDPEATVAPESTRAAAAVALAAAAARAKLMADEQTAEMERLTRQVLRVQSRRVRIKLKCLEQMGEVLAAEFGKAEEALGSKVEASNDKASAVPASTGGGGQRKR